MKTSILSYTGSPSGLMDYITEMIYGGISCHECNDLKKVTVGEHDNQQEINCICTKS